MNEKYWIEHELNRQKEEYINSKISIKTKVWKDKILSVLFTILICSFCALLGYLMMRSVFIRFYNHFLKQILYDCHLLCDLTEVEFIPFHFFI